MKKKFLGIICYILICTSIPSFVYASDFLNYYSEAQEHLKQNRYTSAIIAFRKALKINYLDNSARIGLINSYLARANYYAEQEKNYDKSANDFRSALFYLKIYPNDEQLIQNSSGMIVSVTDNLNQCIRVIGLDTTASSRFKLGEELKAVGNLSAAAYEFSKAAQNDKYFGSANIQIADLLKALGNEQRALDYYKLVIDKQNVMPTTRMKYARSLDRLGKYDEAVIQYNLVLADSKGEQEILYALERIYMKKLAQSPSDAELNANIGAIKQALGDYESALNYYAKAEQINPNNINTRLNVGTLFQQKREYDKALKSYNSILMLNPNHPQALLYKAQCLKDTGDIMNAISTYKKLLSVDPANHAGKTELALLLKQTMQPSEYIAYMLQNSEPNDLYDFAYELHKDNKIDDAINAYQSVITKMPTKVDAYVNLAICYATKDDYAKAIEILNNAKSKFPTNNTVLKTLQSVQKDSISTQLATANGYFENKDYQRAIQEYLRINPATEDSLVGIAASYQALNDNNNAIEYYKKAEKINPNNADILYYIGYIYSETQNWSLAENYLNKAIQKNPNLNEAKELLTYVNQNGTLTILNDAISLYENKDFTNALTKFNNVIGKDNKNAYAYYYRGLIYDEQKQYSLAIKDYLNVLKNSNEFPITNYLLAVDYDNLNNYKEAYKYYTKFISTYTTQDEFLQYAKSRMEELKPYAS